MQVSPTNLTVKSRWDAVHVQGASPFPRLEWLQEVMALVVVIDLHEGAHHLQE